MVTETELKGNHKKVREIYDITDQVDMQIAERRAGEVYDKLFVGEYFSAAAGIGPGTYFVEYEMIVQNEAKTDGQG